MEEKIYSVSSLNKYIKMLFEQDTFLNFITIKGEITNFKAHYTGHLYFTLKDEFSAIKCVMFKSQAAFLNFTPEDGMKVVIRGQVSVFERDGTYQIYCKSMKQEGLGDLYLAYEKLKEKLCKEGLFDEEIKKKIPFLPSRVGVITSKTGAVIRDIINVSTRRYNKVNLVIYPAAVQGVNVPETVIKGIETFNKLNNVDVIIIARGGGSFEDLFGFNDEGIARAIFKSNIPIVSAVGHETDFTICDFVADLRAPTPSAAAELVYPEYSEIIKKILMSKGRIINSMNNYILRKKEFVTRLKSMKLEKVPLDIINKYHMTIDNIMTRSQSKLRLLLEHNKSKCQSAIAKIDALSPLKTLSRGYSVVQSKENNKVIKSIKDLKKDDKLNLILQDGTVDVVVE